MSDDEHSSDESLVLSEDEDFRIEETGDMKEIEYSFRRIGSTKPVPIEEKCIVKIGRSTPISVDTVSILCIDGEYFFCSHTARTAFSEMRKTAVLSVFKNDGLKATPAAINKMIEEQEKLDADKTAKISEDYEDLFDRHETKENGVFYCLLPSSMRVKTPPRPRKKPDESRKRRTQEEEEEDEEDEEEEATMKEIRMIVKNTPKKSRTEAAKEETPKKSHKSKSEERSRAGEKSKKEEKSKRDEKSKKDDVSPKDEKSRPALVQSKLTYANPAKWDGMVQVMVPFRRVEEIMHLAYATE